MTKGNEMRKVTTVSLSTKTGTLFFEQEILFNTYLLFYTSFNLTIIDVYYNVLFNV